MVVQNTIAKLKKKKAEDDKKKDLDPEPAIVEVKTKSEVPNPKPEPFETNNELKSLKKPTKALVQTESASPDGLSDTQKQKAIQSVLAKVKKMNKNKDFEKIANIKTEKKKSIH